MRQWFPFLVVLIAFVTPAPPASPVRSLEPQIVVEDGVFIGGQLPMWGEVCKSTDVLGGPDTFYPVLYSVSVGDTVRLHELSRPTGEWVMIGQAEWMPLKSLCEW